MSQAANTTSRIEPDAIRPARGGAPLVVVCAILAALGAWWLLNPYTVIKQSVPWPPQAQVDGDFRLASLDKSFGPYKLVEEDGLFPDAQGRYAPDGRPDGEVVYDKTSLEALGVGTSYDSSRFKDRRSNWYVARLYRDARESRESPYYFWRLDVTYYTGALDLVPHVPERCLMAAGAVLIPSLSGKVTFAPIAGTANPWDRKLTINRTGWEQSVARGLRRGVQYYTFSLNGKPEGSWEKVRWTLGLPGIKYCYFAKIQFAPAGQIADIDEADRKAQEFLSYALPAVLKQLPMPPDVERLTSK